MSNKAGEVHIIYYLADDDNSLSYQEFAEDAFEVLEHVVVSGARSIPPIPMTTSISCHVNGKFYDMCRCNHIDVNNGRDPSALRGSDSRVVTKYYIECKKY